MPAIRDSSFLQNCPFSTIDDDHLFLRLERSLPPFSTDVSRGVPTTTTPVFSPIQPIFCRPRLVRSLPLYIPRLERSLYHHHSRFSSLSPIPPTFDRLRLVRSSPLHILTSQEELKRLRISTSRYRLPLSIPDTSTNFSTFDRSLPSLRLLSMQPILQSITSRE